jgi:hypothetical protein
MIAYCSRRGSALLDRLIDIFLFGTGLSPQISTAPIKSIARSLKCESIEISRYAGLNSESRSAAIVFMLEASSGDDHGDPRFHSRATD